MRNVLIYLLFVSALHSAGIEFKSHGLNATVFDSSGHLIRRLTANSALGPVEDLRLEIGRIDFFSTDSEVDPQTVIEFSQGIYRKFLEKEVITGQGLITLTSHRIKAMVEVSGYGYECTLKAKKNPDTLTLHSNVKFYLQGRYRMTADKAIVSFGQINSHPSVECVDDAFISGNVIVVPVGTGKNKFDKLECASAKYNAAQNEIFVKSPVTVWKNGEKSLLNDRTGFFEINTINLLKKLKSSPSTIAPPANQQSPE